tara:strand:+ start:96466 stop:96921 length:456 start_codon:yes stop_codon:yes gene_type:complete
MSIARGKLSAIGLVLALLLVGAAVGVAVDRAWIRDQEPIAAGHSGPPPSMRADRIFSIFKERLNLTEAQATEVRTILLDVETFAHGIREGARPKMDAAMAAADEKIRVLLTVEQATIYDELIEERKRRIRKRTSGHPGHGRGPRGHRGPPR